ncbi:sulfotransferase [Alteromonas sp. AMM-1]|uniref:sulfotransferase n=1 Tax=Alteromonas sp. AMM-1 TaxID=3394233 RepID=UPI0039A5B9B1
MPQSPFQIRYEQAVDLANEGKPADAIKLLYPLVQQSPGYYQAWLLFSRCLFETGYVKEAVQIARHADSVDPLASHFQRIQQCMQHQRIEEATGIARAMLEDVPHHCKALFTLASLALSAGQPEVAIAILTPEVPLQPANITLRRLLADGYAKSGQYSNAIAASKVLVQLDECFENLWRLLGLLFKYGQYDEFLHFCEIAAKYVDNQSDESSQLALLKGQALRVLGRRDESIHCLTSSLTINPNNAEAWLALADFKDYVFTEAQKHQLESLLNRPVSAEVKCMASFAYARLCDAKGNTQASFKHYAAANALKVTNPHVVEGIQQDLANIKHQYCASALYEQAEALNSHPTPVFIVGLPRSGSTLVEQMLACHSHIEGTMEQPTLLHVEQRANRHSQTHYHAKLGDTLSKLSAKELTDFGNIYLKESAVFRHQNMRFFTDKQPFNFRLIGLIHKILPKAIIIDVVRNPMDCGLSLFKQYFHSGVDFSYNLNHIGTVYNHYRSMMAHWDSVLPGKVIRIHYESLIDDPTTQITRVLNYMGLEFEPQCLSFHTTSRAIHTASSEQVRQPINRNGVCGWVNLAGELQVLQDSLDPAYLSESLALKQT